MKELIVLQYAGCVCIAVTNIPCWNHVLRIGLHIGPSSVDIDNKIVTGGSRLDVAGGPFRTFLCALLVRSTLVEPRQVRLPPDGYQT